MGAEKSYSLVKTTAGIVSLRDPERLDVVSPNLSFEGRTKDRSSDRPDLPKWQIMKVFTLGTETIRELVNDSEDFDQKWEDRASLFPYVNSSSLVFNGSTQYVDLPNAANIDFLDSTVFSLSLWVKMGPSAGTKVFITKSLGSATANHTISLYLPSNERLSFIIRAAPVTNRLRVRTPVLAIDDGAWHHIAVTYDGLKLAAGVAIYFDGVSQTINVQNDTLIGPVTAGRDWKIGVAGNINGSFFTGNMDEPSWWDKVLSQAEVDEIYNSGSVNDLAAHSAVANLITHPTFDDSGNFPISKDRADGNDVTLINMSLLNYDTDAP